MNAALFPDVVVNGETIPSAAIAAEAQNHEAPKGKPGIAWRKAAQALTIRALLLQEARRRGLQPDPQELTPGRFETDDEALIRVLLDDALDIPVVAEAEIESEWMRDTERFRSPPLWEVSHILCACDPDDPVARDLARLRAEALIAGLGGDAADFAATAARESDCGSKSSGGNLGQLGPGDTVPEFETALRTLAEGDVTPAPVLSRHGWHIIRLNALAPGQVLPFAVVRPRIRQALEKAAWARTSREFIRSLADGARVVGVTLDPI